jgi:hypothetical protein
MVPSYKDSPWQVGIKPDASIIQIRVPNPEGGFQDYWVPPDESNMDYQQYLAWRAEGNIPKILFDQEMT